MLSWAAVACLLGGASASASASASSTSLEGALRVELDRSLSRYTALETLADVERWTSQVLSHPEGFVLIWENRIITASQFLLKEKNRKHVNFLSSVMQESSVANAAYLFDGNSTGWCPLDDGVTMPCLVIAKRGGYSEPGVLVPNPYFHDLAFWETVRSVIKRRAASRPFATRLGKAFWRGHIADAWRDWDSAHCADEYGNHARLQALSLSLSEEAVDVRCWLAKKCRVRDASARPCAQYPYDDAMARVAADPELATRTGHVAKENFTLFKYVLNLPGSSSGSYSRNLNHLWFLQSVVLLWKAPFVEWYYPALRNGETHVDVDHRSLADAVRELEAHPEKAAAILKNAKRVDAELVCPNCIARYLRLAIERVRKRFQLSKVLDDPCAAREFFARTLNCSRLDLFEVLPTARQPGAYDIDGRRNLMTTAATRPLTCAALIEDAAARCDGGVSSLPPASLQKPASPSARHKSHNGRSLRAYTPPFALPARLL